MHLPAGVFERPRERLLIAKDKWAIIRIDTDPSRYPNNTVYTVPDDYEHDKQLTYEYDKALAPFLRGDWEDFDRYFCLSPLSWQKTGVKGGLVEAPIIFSRAEHASDYKRSKLPNIMVVPNLTTQEWRGLAGPLTVFGCTMGHYHPPFALGSRTQEVIEFQSYGMLALDRGEGNVELWIAKDGDKVAIPSGCYKTLYNLRDKDNPLITLDFSADSANYSDEKMDLARTYGPLLLAYHNNFEVIITLNRLYINNEEHSIGVRSAKRLKEKKEREIRIPRRARLDLGELLYEELTSNPDLIGRFASLGLLIKKASPEAMLESISQELKPPIYFSRPLIEAAKRGNKVYTYFFPDVEVEKTPPPLSPYLRNREVVELGKNKKMASATDDSGNAPRDVESRPLNRPLVVVVEGGGDWVGKTYRQLFKKKIDVGRKLSVFYADDTRWKDKRPQWADPEKWLSPEQWDDPSKTGLQSWEVYLDKKDPNDVAKYRNLRPDVVFVVTPDFTHSALAQHWLGKAPIVFVEKPFDSQVRNVDDLKLRYAFEESETTILGLDHYQFYALPVHKRKAEILSHLDHVIAKVEFYLTEERPIEDDRVYSLQYGLTLDLLPHLIALLTYFGDIRTIDEIEVIEAGQYDPLESGPSKTDISKLFEGETYSRVRFTFEDDSGTGFHIPCLAVVGKGFSQEVKYLEVTGRNGNAIRVDLVDKNKLDQTFTNNHSQYPFDSLFFILGEQSSADEVGVSERDLLVINDPYNDGKKLRVLPYFEEEEPYCQRLLRSRYEWLLDDLLNETTTAVASTLRVNEGQEIVRTLDRIWRAIQRKREFWKRHPLRQAYPIQPQDWT